MPKILSLEKKKTKNTTHLVRRFYQASPGSMPCSHSMSGRTCQRQLMALGLLGFQASKARTSGGAGAGDKGLEKEHRGIWVNRREPRPSSSASEGWKG